ncbi:hypothetical protein GCM10027217_39060 [Pseudomaricurvus hydrocarbonicus]
MCVCVWAEAQPAGYEPAGSARAAAPVASAALTPEALTPESLTPRRLTIVTSIQPLSLMAKAVVGDHVDVTNLLQPGQTPHDFAFKVSDRQRLERADLLLWVGEALEPYLVSIAALQPQLSMASLVSSSGRQGLQPAGSDGDRESGDAHRGDSNEDNNEKNSDHHRGEGDHASHHLSHGDQHLWLNPEYGAAMMQALAKRLAELDPVNAAEYQQNARDESRRVLSLTSRRRPVEDRDAEVRHDTSPAARQYAVVHKAYQHFLEYFGYPSPLVLTPIPELSPGARQLWRVGEQLSAGDCLLIESASPRKWVNSFAQRQQLKLVRADIMGSSDGVTTYYRLLEELVKTFDGCTAVPPLE